MRRRDLLPAVVAAAVVLPDRLRLDRWFPFVDAVAWRPHAAVATALAAAVVGRRPAAAGLAAVGLAGLAAVAGRAVRRVCASTAGGQRPEGADGGLSILTLNVWLGRADTGALAALIARERPDVVVLPEAGTDFRDKLMPLLDGLGYRAWVSTGPGTEDGHSVTLLAAPRAGEVTVRVGTAMRLPHLDMTGGVLGPRTLRAVHTTAPLKPAWVPRWRRDLRILGEWCRADVPPIVVGDLNATLDHSALRAALGGCRSAATGTGRGLLGTYPAFLPRWAGIQIDHLLVPEGSSTTRFDVVDVPGADHRGLLVTVRPPDVGAV